MDILRAATSHIPLIFIICLSTLFLSTWLKLPIRLFIQLIKADTVTIAYVAQISETTVDQVEVDGVAVVRKEGFTNTWLTTISIEKLGIVLPVFL